MRKHLYTVPEAHGYLMEAKACKNVVKEIDRLADKYRRAVEREKAAKRAELEAVMNTAGRKTSRMITAGDSSPKHSMTDTGNFFPPAKKHWKTDRRPSMNW